MAGFREKFRNILKQPDEDADYDDYYSEEEEEEFFIEDGDDDE